MGRTNSSFAVVLGAAALGASALTLPAEAQRTGINLTEPAQPAEAPTTALNLNYDARQQRAPDVGVSQPDAEQRAIQLEISAAGDTAGVPLDFSIAPRASLGTDSEGDIARRGQGAEVRVGRGLVERREDGEQMGSRWYVFAASDDEALTWQPGSRNEFGGRGSGFALQDQVEVGDMAAGVTYERSGVQASLAYVEREISSTIGTHTESRDESFTGLTLTMRR